MGDGSGRLTKSAKCGYPVNWASILADLKLECDRKIRSLAARPLRAVH